MATKLHNLKVTKVDFVDEGANPDAHIKLFKRREQKGGTQPATNQSDGSGVWKRFFGAIAKAVGMNDFDIAEIEKGDAVSFDEKCNEVKNRKIADEIWDLCFALQSSLYSILNDEDMDSSSSSDAMKDSLDEFVKVVSDAIPKWVVGKTNGIERTDDTEVSSAELEVLKATRDRLSETIAKSVGDSELVTINNQSKGEPEEMKVDKSKMTPAERAFFEDIEKRYGTEDGTQVENFVPETSGVEPTIAKSNTSSEQAGPTQLSVAETDNTDIYKGLHPAVKAELEALNKFKTDAEERELGEVAKKYEIIGKKKEELVPLFKSLKATGGTAYADMIAVLDGVVATVEKSGVFSEIGKSGHGADTIGTAETKIEGIAKKYQEQDASLSYEAAVAKAWENNPDLINEYEEEAGF